MAIDISVVVPTCNRIKRLNDCLNSLFEQDYPREKLEIIIVDDRANDKVKEMLGGLKAQYFPVKYVAQRNKGPARARNQGAKASLGKIIAFVDDDCTADKDWARLMVKTHQANSNIIAVGGANFTSTQKTSVLVSQFLSTCSIETNINGRSEVIFFPTCNVSFKRDVFKDHEFNERFPLPGGEDLEFFWRLFKDGHRFIWDKDIKVIHYRDESVQSFIKQAYIYGRGNLLVQHLHKDQPLLKELKTGRFSFWMATLINIIKIPRFTFLLGKRLIEEDNIKDIYKKISVYLFFVLHKVVYMIGNVFEYFIIRKGDPDNGQNRLSIPRLLILDITHSCNLSCRICDIWKTRDSEKDIEISYIKRLLLQAKKLGIKEIALSGGEPLLRNDIFEIFDYARRIGIRNLGVLTNGILVEKYIKKLKPFLKNNTISLVVSLDSLKPNIHNNIRNSDIAWQKVIESIRSLSLLKKEYRQINFNVITIILNQNIEELLDLARFIKSSGSSSLQFQPLLPNNLKIAERKKSIFWIHGDSLDTLDKAVDKLIDFKRGNQGFIRNSIENLSLIKKYYRGSLNSNEANCFSAYRTILISNQGKCTTCFSSYGDIKRQGLKDILESKEILKARERVKKCYWPCLLPCFCDL
ncbi:MAG: glycosyltransferase [Candidatus Omnitrophica bacterium]|nr:glycosyltransferase [Candidatus Omnitrophota bacterium]